MCLPSEISEDLRALNKLFKSAPLGMLTMNIDTFVSLQFALAVEVGPPKWYTVGKM